MPLARGNGNDIFVERRRIVVGGAQFGGTGTGTGAWRAGVGRSLAQQAGTPMETSPPEPSVELTSMNSRQGDSPFDPCPVAHSWGFSDDLVMGLTWTAWKRHIDAPNPRR